MGRLVFPTSARITLTPPDAPAHPAAGTPPHLPPHLSQALSQDPAKPAVTATGKPAGVGNGASAHNERYGFDDAAASYGAAPYARWLERESPRGG